jgi:hypothetical protein
MMTWFLESTDQEKSAEMMTFFLESKNYCDTTFHVKNPSYMDTRRINRAK